MQPALKVSVVEGSDALRELDARDDDALSVAVTPSQAPHTLTGAYCASERITRRLTRRARARPALAPRWSWDCESLSVAASSVVAHAVPYKSRLCWNCRFVYHLREIASDMTLFLLATVCLVRTSFHLLSCSPAPFIAARIAPGS